MAEIASILPLDKVVWAKQNDLASTAAVGHPCGQFTRGAAHTCLAAHRRALAAKGFSACWQRMDAPSCFWQ